MSEKVQVPTLVGLSQKDAEASLLKSGLQLGTVTTAASPSATIGTVLSTKPSAGKAVDDGSSVALEVSSGPTQVAVPDLTKLNQADAEAALKNVGLTVGKIALVSTSAVPSGTISSSTPAQGVSTALGSAIDIQVSSGPSQVIVPDVTGFTRAAAEAMLRNTGLTLGSVTGEPSTSIPSGGVTNTKPAAGSVVQPQTQVALSVSSGPEKDFTRFVPGLLSGLAVVVLGVIVWGITAQTPFLTDLAKTEVARGLITFLIAFATVGIALILAISAIVVKSADDNDKRFERSNQVLTMLVGVLGTIVGFYFGSEVRAPQQQTSATIPAVLTVTTTALPTATKNTAYDFTLQASGGTPPLNWSVSPNLPAGLNLDAKSGQISGTPSAVSPSTEYTFTVTDSASSPTSKSSKLKLQVK